ncbi:MAG: glycosyltransferase family 4 protein [Nitrososphaera sp.]|nr:glycosyltransferase family 4 protein [Nitrososphaera sp.]
MRILWLSWRDTRNPEAGGAEVFTHQVSRRLIRDHGHEITLFAARFPGSSESEVIDGINIVRNGGRYSVYDRAKEYCLNNESRFDLVIDEINTKPFLTPRYVKRIPILALIHQVPRRAVLYELPFPVNYLTYHYLVKRWLSNYRKIPTITVSLSQQDLLRKFGFAKTFVVQQGLSVTPLAGVPKKESAPTLVFMGRLKRYKLPDHAIRAFSFIKNRIPEAKMYVIGDGYMRKKLERMAGKDVVFVGRADDNTKFDLLKKAHVLLMPSVEEGWGLVVTESNAMGTPAIAYNVVGLRDSVKTGQTGILLERNSPESMAEAAVKLLESESALAKLSEGALEFSRNFSWDCTAGSVNEIIVKIC